MDFLCVSFSWADLVWVGFLVELVGMVRMKLEWGLLISTRLKAEGM